MSCAKKQRTPDVDLANISPFDDPGMKRKKKITAIASFKAFNVVTTRLLGDLSRIYPDDLAMRLVTAELTKVVSDPKNTKLAALMFFKEIRKGFNRADGSPCMYLDLLAEHSDAAFTGASPVTVLDGIGMQSKWSSMEPELKDAIWAYIDRLIHLSAQAVFSSSNATNEMNALSRAVVGAAVTGHGNSPTELVEDPKVRAAAEKFVDTIH
jgi:hypothetical protein